MTTTGYVGMVIEFNCALWSSGSSRISRYFGTRDNHNHFEKVSV